MFPGDEEEVRLAMAARGRGRGAGLGAVANGPRALDWAPGQAVINFGGEETAGNEYRWNGQWLVVKANDARWIAVDPGGHAEFLDLLSDDYGAVPLRRHTPHPARATGSLWWFDVMMGKAGQTVVLRKSVTFLRPPAAYRLGFWSHSLGSHGALDVNLEDGLGVSDVRWLLDSTVWHLQGFGGDYRAPERVRRTRPAPVV